MPTLAPTLTLTLILTRWQLEDLSLLLGSDTVIFQSDEQGGNASLDTSKSADGYHAPGISVRPTS